METGIVEQIKNLMECSKILQNFFTATNILHPDYYTPSYNAPIVCLTPTEPQGRYANWYKIWQKILKVQLFIKSGSNGRLKKRIEFPKGEPPQNF